MGSSLPSAGSIIRSSIPGWGKPEASQRCSSVELAYEQAAKAQASLMPQPEIVGANSRWLRREIGMELSMPEGKVQKRSDERLRLSRA